MDGNGTIDNDGNNFNNLLLGTSRVYLKATLSSDIDLSAYNNKVVQLSGEFPSYNATNGGWAIHWANSRKNGDIYYYGDNQNGTGLQFTIDANNNKREYYIEWVFEPSINNYSGGEIGFNYNISVNSGSPVQYSLSDDQTATIAFANEPTTETVLINYNFNDNTQPSGYQCAGGTSNFSNGTLSFTATGTGTNDYDNQIRFTGLSIVNGATYKLTFKIRSSVSDSTGLTIAFDDPSDNYSWCGEFNDNTSKLMLNDSGNFTEVTLTTTATKDVANGRLFINLGHLGACTIEIDDLKLVRTN